RLSDGPASHPRAVAALWRSCRAGTIARPRVVTKIKNSADRATPDPAAGSGSRQLIAVSRAAAQTDRCSGMLQLFARQPARLLYPGRELRVVELVVLIDVEIARFVALGFDGWDRAQRRAPEERHLDVFCKAVKAQEPALALQVVKGR